MTWNFWSRTAQKMSETFEYVDDSVSVEWVEKKESNLRIQRTLCK